MSVSEAQKRATAKYEEKNYDKILVRFSKGTKDRIKAQSSSVNTYIIQAVLERLEADEGDILLDSDAGEIGELNADSGSHEETDAEPSVPRRDQESEALKEFSGQQENKPKTAGQIQAELEAMIAKKRAAQGLPEIGSVKREEPKEEELPKTPVYYDAEGKVIENPVIHGYRPPVNYDKELEKIRIRYKNLKTFIPAEGRVPEATETEQG